MLQIISLIGTPTLPGTYNFTITATDSVGVQASKPFSITVFPVVTIAPPTLPGGTVGAAYNQTLVGSGGGGGPYNFVAVGALPPGLGLTAGGGLSGTPNTAGTYNFSVTATSQLGASTTAPYSIVIAPVPPVVVGPFAAPAGTVNVAYGQTFTATGGAGGPYVFTSTGTLPPGLTLASNGNLSGTPSAAGSFAFTIIATDQASSTNGIRGYTIVINPAPVIPPVCSAPVANPSGPVAPGTAINVSVSCTGSPTSYAWTANGAVLPNATGASISANPAVNTTYGVTATNAGGTSSPPQTVTVNVTTVSAPVCQPIVGTPGNPVVAGTPVTMTGSCTNSPTFAWTVNGTPVGQPTNVLVQSPTQTTTYTLTATNTAGSAVTTYQVVVADPIPTCFVPTVTPSSSINSGTTVTITSACIGNNITRYNWTAAGQPLAATTPSITATPLVTTTYTVTATNPSGTSSPPQSVTVNVTVQPPPPSNITNLSGTPPPADPGSTVPLSVRVTNSVGQPVSNAQFATTVTGGTGTLTQVTLSPPDGVYQFNFVLGAGTQARSVGICLQNDPTKCVNYTITTNAAVIVEPAKSIIAPQAITAITTPGIQINNVRQRLDQVRLQNYAGNSQALRISLDGQALPPLNAFALAPAKDTKDAKTETGGGAAADDAFPRWGAFINGDVLVGRQSTVQSTPVTQNGFKLTSKGITVGADYRFDNNSMLGAAFGYLNADTDLNENLGTQSARGYSFSVYGSYVPVPNAYIDLIANFGHNTYDSDRKQVTTSANATSNTSGDQWAIALSAGYNFNQGPWTAVPYGRVEYIDAKVDGFTESGTAGEALTVSEQRIKATTLSIGGQVSYSISTSFGVVIPYGRLEFQHIAQSSAQTVYAGLAGIAVPAQIIPTLSNDKSFGNYAVGVSGMFAKNFSAFFNFEQLFGKDNYSQEKYTLGIRYGF